MWDIIEVYEGQRTVLESTDDEADALKIRDWHRDQWSDQEAAKQCVFVKKRT